MWRKGERVKRVYGVCHDEIVSEGEEVKGVRRERGDKSERCEREGKF